jgi:hypothetical protein
MKLTGKVHRQSQMVEGVCVIDGDYDELLREALRVAMGIDTFPNGRDDFSERYGRIIALMRAYVTSPEGNDAPTMMARLAVGIIDLIPLAKRQCDCDMWHGAVTISRLAVTPEQIAAYDLPTAPPKPTDRRAFAGQTCQAEALAPDVLASILRDAIEARIGGRIRYRRADIEAFVEAHVRSRADGAPLLPTGSAARMVSQPRERAAEAGKTK